MGFGVIIAVIIGTLSMDQLLKFWAVSNLMGQESIVLIPGLLKLTYVENFGAAFGILDGMRWFLVLLTGGFLLLLLLGLYQNKIEGFWVRLSMTMITAGGLGNLIDRVRIGYVVDYLDINDFFSFPVFNLADCFVTIGATILMIYILFFEGKTSKEI